MINYKTGVLSLQVLDFDISKESEFNDFDDEIFIVYGFNNDIYKKLVIHNQLFYGTNCSIEFMFTKEKLVRISISNQQHYFMKSDWLKKEDRMTVRDKNFELLKSIIPDNQKYELDKNNRFLFKWGYITSVHDCKGGFSHIVLKYN